MGNLKVFNVVVVVCMWVVKFIVEMLDVFV